MLKLIVVELRKQWLDNKNINKRESRIGETTKNKFGTEMEIIEYDDYRNIMVKFKDEYETIVKTRYDAFLDGRVYNPYDRRNYGVGYIGYDLRDSKGKSNPKIFAMWSGMIRRCYSGENNTFPTYIGCSVCDEWHNYMNFKKWYDENLWEVEDDFMCLDKDIIIKGNKIYSPNTCIIVPNRINVLFIKSKKSRGKYPIGVSYHKSKSVFDSYYHIVENGKSRLKFIKSFKNPTDAFYAYKETKEKYIKKVADEYKNKYPNFPKRLYNAMYSYEVEITD